MKEQFKNKTFVIIGDSITEHGVYIYDLRAYFQGKKDKCYFYNRGTGGNRAVMSPYIFESETHELKPDYIGVCFGANDIGLWLYASDKEITEEMLAERKARDQEYFASYEKICDIIKESGATPVLMSPYATDEYLEEKDDIETIKDNDEKAEKIKADFYKKKTYKIVNEKFRIYAQKIKEIAELKGALYCPIFEKTYEKMLGMRGLFREDGLHYSFDKGHHEIAKIILEFLGVEDIPDEFNKTPENDELEKLVQLERRAGMIPRATPFNPMFGDFTYEEMRASAEDRMKNGGSEWARDVGRCFIEYYDKLDQIRLEIKERTENLK